MVAAGDSGLDHHLLLLCGVLRRGLDAFHCRLAAGVLDGGGQAMLEGSRSHPLLLWSDLDWHGQQLGPWRLRNSLRRQRPFGVSTQA